MSRTIWQYWETRGIKPGFVDGLLDIARRNSGCEVIQVTPGTLSSYLPDLPADVLRIEEMAHKADMIRALLVARHGGMWLDSDAIVLRDLNWLFDLLDEHEFIGFNDGGLLAEPRPWVRINCFLSRPGGTVIGEWTRRQHAKFPRVVYEWQEIGTEILHPLCLDHRDRVRILPFELISPVPWDQVQALGQKRPEAGAILAQCSVMMLSNESLKTRAPDLRRHSCAELAAQDTLLGGVLRGALSLNPAGENRPCT